MLEDGLRLVPKKGGAASLILLQDAFRMVDMYAVPRTSGMLRSCCQGAGTDAFFCVRHFIERDFPSLQVLQYAKNTGLTPLVA